jgi:tRNA threonylcarbamoyladenosine biosynthesis protein TsaE
MHTHFTQILLNEAATLDAGLRFAAHLKSGMVIYLHGDLGAGKTTFVRGVLHGLGHAGKVKSPTYTLVEPYLFADMALNHFDLYRFTDAHEWEAAGFRDYFNPQSVCMIEWPEKAQGVIPTADIDIYLAYEADCRRLRYEPHTPDAKQMLFEMNKHV